MNEKATYWIYFKQIVADLLEDYPDTLNQLNELLDTASKAILNNQHQLLCDIFEFLGEMPGWEELGFKMGSLIPSTAYSNITMGMRIAPTYKDSLRLVSSFHHMSAPLVYYSFNERDARFEIGFRLPMSGNAEALLVSAVVSQIDNDLSKITGEENNFKNVCLTPSSEPLKQLYKKYLSVTPDTTHSNNVIEFYPELIEQPNPFADPQTFDQFLTQCEEMKTTSTAVLSLYNMAQDIIMANINAPPDLSELACRLNVTPRQLRSSLSNEGSSYRKIIRDCRVAYASQLFNNAKLSVSEVAYRLGYSDVATFSHSFKRWTGKNPSQFQKEILDS